MPAGEQDALLRVALFFFVWIINKDSFHNMMKGPSGEQTALFILATVHGEVTMMTFLPDDE
jgi:hypothetical protein